MTAVDSSRSTAVLVRSVASGHASVAVRRAFMYNRTRYGDIDVCWSPDLLGGGREFGQHFVPVVRRLFGPVDRVFECCAGPGFIGFSLLAQGLARTLCLADINPTAVAAVRATIELNGLADRVTVYESDALTAIPDREQWDLVIGNPPHFASSNGDPNLVEHDPDWGLHRALYRDIARFLKPHASVLLQASRHGSGPETFARFLAETPLTMVRAFALGTASNALAAIYFIWTRLRSPELIDVDTPAEYQIRVSSIAPVLRIPSDRWRWIAFELINDTSTDAAVIFQTREDHDSPAIVPAGTRVITPPRLLPPGTTYVVVDVCGRTRGLR